MSAQPTTDDLLELLKRAYHKVMTADVDREGRLERLSRADTDAMRDALVKAGVLDEVAEQGTRHRVE